MEEHSLKNVIGMLELELHHWFKGRSQRASWKDHRDARQRLNAHLRIAILVIRVLRLKQYADCNPAEYTPEFAGKVLKALGNNG